MRIETFILKCIVFVSCCLLPMNAISSSDYTKISGLLDRAEVYIKLGVVDKGAGQSFEEAMRLVTTADNLLAGKNGEQAETKTLMLETKALKKRSKFSPSSMMSDSMASFPWRD